MTNGMLGANSVATKVYAGILAVLVHCALFSMLFFGVRWQNREPESVVVELWDKLPSVPQQERARTPTPAPEPQNLEPKPEPKREVELKARPEHKSKHDIRAAKHEAKAKPREEPQPKKVDVALKHREEPKPQDKPKPEVKPTPAAEKPAPEPDEEPDDTQQSLKEMLDRESESLKRLRERENAKRQEQMRLAALQQKLAADYISKVRAKIRGNIVMPQDISGNPEAIFDVVQLPNGEIVSAKLRKSSRHSGYDTAVERAILKSSPLPAPPAGDTLVRQLELRFKPLDQR